jgi:hypothetical protein
MRIFGSLLIALTLLTSSVDAQWWRFGRPRPNTPESDIPVELENLKLLHETDFTFEGGFCPPDSLGFSPSHGIAIRPATNSMYITLDDTFKPQIAELAIPALVLSSSAGSLNQATFTATGSRMDPSEGAIVGAFSDGTATSNLANSSALHVWNNKLLFSVEYFYDSTPTQTKAYAVRPLDLTATGSVIGFDAFNGLGVRMITMFAGDVPTEWRTSLGGPVVVGGGISYSAIPNQSWGPSACTMDPVDITGSGTHTCTPLVMYPDGHRTLGLWEDNPPSTPYFNFATQYRGGVIIPNSRTMLFFGVTGTDNFCYGTGHEADYPDLGVKYPDPVLGPFTRCLDPTSPDSGNHGWPYIPIATAYDLADLAQVKAGTKQPWEVFPYDMWTIDFPVTLDPAEIRSVASGASWDATNSKLWLTQMSQFGAGCSGNNGIMWRLSVDTTP